jgi:hypothetical protein
MLSCRRLGDPGSMTSADTVSGERDEVPKLV